MLATAAWLARCASAPPSAQVCIVELADGATVAATFKVCFALQGMTVAPAGDFVAGTGHHQLLINQTAIAAAEVVPVPPQHIHYGKGQTEAEVKPAPTSSRRSSPTALNRDMAALAHTITLTLTLTLTVT